MHQPILFNNPPKQNRQKPANVISKQQKHKKPDNANVQTEKPNNHT